MPIYFLSLIGKIINCCYYAASHAMRAKMQPFAAVVAWWVCLLDATLSPLKATESIHGAVWVADSGGHR